MSRKQKIDYRAWARRHFKNDSAMLPPVYSTGYNTPKYVPTIIQPKKGDNKKYNTKWKCACGYRETREHSFHKILLSFNKLSFVACYRCTCPMKFKGIEENFFVKLFVYTKCLLQSLRRK